MESNKDKLLEQIAAVFNGDESDESKLDEIYQALISSGLFDVNRVIIYKGKGK